MSKKIVAREKTNHFQTHMSNNIFLLSHAQNNILENVSPY